MSITIQGVDKLFAQLETLQAIDTLRPPMVRAMARLHERMATYPATPAGSTYRRTGTLGRRWTTQITQSNGLQGKIGNNTIYAPLVQSKQFQASIHKRTGWLTEQQAIAEEERAIVADFEIAIHEAIGA